MSTEELGSENELDWKNRVLCSDESCIGVIGPDGCCKECGLAYKGELPSALVQRSPEDTNSGPVQTTDTDPMDPQSDGEESVQDEAFAFASDDEWKRRTLCSDESCIGVIGPDGRCKECGLPYKG